MTLSQIATLLNETIVPNIFGQGEDASHNPITIAEDLRNIADLGTAVASLSGTELKSYLGDLVVGIFKIYVDTRSYKDETYGLMMEDEAEFGGAIARIKAKLLTASDSAILNPVPASSSGPDYHDGKFYGTELDEKIYSKDVIFKVKYSISTEKFKKACTSASEMSKLIAIVEANVDTTIKNELNGLARGGIRKLILSAYSGGRYIPLMTTYNTEMGFSSTDPGYVSLTTWKNDENFKIWCQTTIMNLKQYLTDINEKYNDGTVPCFVPETDLRALALTEFGTALDTALSNVYHAEMVNGIGEYRKINYWQNGTTEMLPYIKSGSMHDQIVEVTADAPADPTTINHVVMVLYDKYSVFMTEKLEKTTSEYVGAEDFTNFFHHICKQLALDLRNSAIVLTLA